MSRHNYHSRQSDQKNRRNAVQSWPCRTVVPAVCLHQLNVTEDGQERRSVTCRSATGSRVPDRADTCMSADITWITLAWALWRQGKGWEKQSIMSSMMKFKLYATAATHSKEQCQIWTFADSCWKDASTVHSVLTSEAINGTRLQHARQFTLIIIIINTCATCT